MSKINLKKNIALSSLSKVLTILASFIVNWFLSRYLGPELRGKYVYLFTLNSIIWMFLELGVSKSFPYLLQSRKEDPRKLYTFSLFTMIIVGVLVTLLFTLFRPLILDVTNHEYPFYILLILGYYIVVYQFYSRTQAIQLGMDFINDYSLLALLPALIFMLALIPSFWFFPLHSRMEYSFLLNVSVFTLVLFGFQYRLNRKLKLRIRWDKLVVRSSYALGFKAFLSEYIIILLMRIDLLILKQLGTFTQVGIYTLAVNFVDVINISCNTIGAVLLTKLTSLKSDAEALQIMRKIFLMISIFNLIAILGMTGFGYWIIKYMYGPAYLDAYLAFLFLIPAIFGLTLGALFNTFLWSKGFPIFTIVAPIMPLIVKAVVNYLLIPRFSLFGASLASSVAYPLWLIILLIWYFGKNKEMHISCLIPLKQDFREIRANILLVKQKVMSLNLR